MVCMLIDDDKDDQEIFMIAVEKVSPPVECVCADGSDEALSMLRNSKSLPDIIFLDLNMPRVNGKQCLAEIKKLPHAQQIPVFIYSTSADPKDLNETKTLGAHSFLTKPADIEILAKILSGIFSAHGQDHEENSLTTSNKKFA